jgi:hypothetical protein
MMGSVWFEVGLSDLQMTRVLWGETGGDSWNATDIPNEVRAL